MSASTLGRFLTEPVDPGVVLLARAATFTGRIRVEVMPEGPEEAQAGVAAAPNKNSSGEMSPNGGA